MCKLFSRIFKSDMTGSEMLYHLTLIYESLGKIMNDVEILTAETAALKANAEELNLKMDAVIAKIDALQERGQGATPEEIAEIRALVGGTAAAVQAAEDKVDAELTPENP